MAMSVPELCKTRGVSWLELADRSGLDLPKVRAIFQGRWTASPDERLRIAAALTASVDDIAWGHVTPIQHISGNGPAA